MGTCWRCETQVTLSKEQTNCDNCGEVLFYHCNNCAKEFEVKDEDGKLKECSLCGYFYCPHCGICSWTCNKYKWEAEVLKILAPEITQGKFPTTLTKVREIIKYFENVKTSNVRKECDKGIPITYAKGRIKSLLAKREGFRVKNQNDKNAFIKRIDEVTEVPLGTKLTINQIREEGSYGQEYRDAFNLLVCLGKLKVTWQKKKDSEDEYALYERVENEICKYLSLDNLIINECPKCKKQFPRGVIECNICIKKKGKEKGQSYKTKERLNNLDTCQKYRGDFNGKS